MSRTAYAQEALGRHTPLGISAKGRTRFNIFLGVEDGRIALRMEQESDKPDKRDYIAITCDTVVEIALHGEQLYFSKQYDSITTKEELAYYYGGLEYDGYDEKLDRYQIVRFSARFNSGGKYDTVHGFNVNVDFLQGFCDGKPNWVGLTIDPDIKNPPPIHGG